MTTPVAIVIGSDSDWAAMEKCAAQLDQFGVGYSVQVISAHRTPQAAHDFAASARERGVRVIIAAAGMSAALAGVLASLTTLPVIGVPMPGGAMDGVDALLSTAMMPPGVPVATVGLGAARNAAILAVQILAVSDKALADKLAALKLEMAEEVKAKSKALQAKLAK
ncbi:MAG: 5-(carboxyamino)imidazole ribonucleotide mutase [Phycisphaerae bacterium]|nr:5-(carboxyamino)imidazole ribonucleotide mutase [Phycisphaerae bacterium]